MSIAQTACWSSKVNIGGLTPDVDFSVVQPASSNRAIALRKTEILQRGAVLAIPVGGGDEPPIELHSFLFVARTFVREAFPHADAQRRVSSLLAEDVRESPGGIRDD